MFDFVCGIAVGAAFAPFWMMVYGVIKTKVVAWYATISTKSTPK